ncbi:MAG: N5,N10-methylene tetrahydromethanopterin reductase [Solirubrobacterales bacterium]|nr:N5,N10-methylene tetrahydromethanopterin reductase [Solirubrobacterales bacterium]
MEIGIGLPAAIAGVEGQTLLDWARRAEARGFSTLGAIDRVAYGNYEPLAALAAAAAVTERIRLTTSILLAPVRSNHTLFAKQAASVDRLSDGRLVLGIGVGRREDDYTECGLDFHARGRELDALLERVTAVWRDEAHAIGPAPASTGGPQLIFGGEAPASFRRMAKYGAGWIAGGGLGDVFRGGASAAREAWSAAGRPGSPRLLSLSYFALGDGAREAADAYLKDYYAFTGPFAEKVAAGALVTPQQVADRVAEFEEAGCDELIVFPCSAAVAQVDLLADAVGL